MEEIEAQLKIHETKIQNLFKQYNNNKNNIKDQTYINKLILEENNFIQSLLNIKMNINNNLNKL